MTKREFVTKTGDTWEWEETDEVRKAVERLQQDMRDLAAEDSNVKIYDEK